MGPGFRPSAGSAPLRLPGWCLRPHYLRWLALWCSASRMSAGRDVLFGHEIPFPLSDLVIAVATVAAFLPTVCLAHWTISGALRLCQRKRC